MDRLISLQAAIDLVTDMEFMNNTAKGILRDRLRKLPSAQRTGRWIKGGEQPYFRKHFDIVVCSECNKRGERRWNYCPNCGAKMEVDDERI